MKKSIQKIITAAAVLFAASIVNSAHAIGAIYEVPFTLTLNLSSQGSSINVPINGTYRDAVNNYSVTAVAITAARDECRDESADDGGIADELGIEQVEDGITIAVAGANVNPLLCRTDNTLAFGDSQYAAFVTGLTVIENPPSGTSERFYGIGSSRESAISAARTACRRVYSDSDTCSTNSADIEVIRGQSVASSGGGGGSSSDDDDDILLYAVGGAAIIGLLLLASSGYAEDAWTFTPRYDISNESGFSANAGGRWDFHKDEWHLYFSGDGSTNGKFNYQSGGSYTADFWTAEFSESVSGKTADYDLSLSSNFGGGIWKLSPTYRLHSEYSDSEFDTQNSLNLESEFRYNNWQIRPTAGFNWREFGEFADSGTFRINAVHRF